MTTLSRRRFVQSIIAATVAGSVPVLDARSLLGAASSNGPIVVTVEMVGGNDALNMIGNFGLGAYRDLRGAMAVPVAPSLRLEAELYAHPRLQNIARRYREGTVAVVEGVGDERADRSHFSGLARWESGRADGTVGRTGWLGRWLDQLGTDVFGGIAVEPVRMPLHLVGSGSRAITVSPDSSVFDIDRTTAIHRENLSLIGQLGRNRGMSDRARKQLRLTADAMRVAPMVAPAVAGTMPENNFVRDCTVARRLLELDLGARAISVSMAGFDTHARQISTDAISGEHADRLQAIDVGVETLLGGLPASLRERVVVVIYSEFGRRPSPNAAGGTDHGTAGSVLVIGDRVRGGRYGEPPSLRRLDARGDLLPTVRFQDVYATVLLQHLGADARQVLGGAATAVGSMFDGTPPGPPDAGPTPATGTLAERAETIRNRRERTAREYLRYHSPTF